MSGMPHGFSVRHVCCIRIISSARAAPLFRTGAACGELAGYRAACDGFTGGGVGEKVQKAYFETFTIIQTLLFLPGMLD
ncbi:MAG: hypothetical protein ACLU38_10655 [Dysosmobacter sp.]